MRMIILTMNDNREREVNLSDSDILAIDTGLVGLNETVKLLYYISLRAMSVIKH